MGEIITVEDTKHSIFGVCFRIEELFRPGNLPGILRVPHPPLEVVRHVDRRALAVPENTGLGVVVEQSPDLLGGEIVSSFAGKLQWGSGRTRLQPRRP